MSIDWNQIVIAGVGVISALSGVALGEFFKRKEQEGLFSEIIFQKKLKIYEELYERLTDISNQAFDFARNNNLSSEERLKIWSGVILPFSDFLDRNDMYIDENIKLHVSVCFIGVEEIPRLSKNQQDKRMGDLNLDLQKAKQMIQEELGVKRLHKFFTKVNKPDLNSRWTEYAESIRNKVK